MRRLAGFAIGVAVLVGASPASAGTLSVEGDTVVYEAAPGEDNTVETSSLSISDSTATMTRGPGCRPGPPEEAARYDAPHALRCYGLDYSNVARMNISTGDGNDEVWEHGGALLGTIDTGAGDDRVLAYNGLVLGGDGDDTISKDSGAVDGGAGDDHITTMTYTNMGDVQGGPGADTIDLRTATSRRTETPPVYGGDGDDTINVLLHGFPFVGKLHLDGGGGHDSMSVADGGWSDSLQPPMLDGSLGTVLGGEGNDGILLRAFTHPEPDADGGPGDDTIDGIGSTGLRGGEGDDRLVLRPEAGGGRRHRAPGLGCPSTPEWSLISLYGTGDGGPGNDWLTSVTAAVLAGGEGNDRLGGAAGTDVLSGGPGDDVLQGGGSTTATGSELGDRLDGGPGSDVVHGGGAGASGIVCYADRRSGVVVDLATPGGDGEPGEGDDVSGVSQVIGSNADDVIAAGTAPLRVNGLAGDDTVTGGPESDVLTGGAGDDTIDGGGGDDRMGFGRDDEPGDDRFSGGAGDDTIQGGRGVDRVEGDDGRDTLRGGSADDWLSGGGGEDVLIADDAGSVFNHSPIISLAHDDQLWCGGSTDVVRADYADGIGSDCELAVEGTPKWRKVRVGSTSRLTVRARCAWVVRRPCVGTLRIMAARALPALPSNAAGVLRSRVAGPPAACRPLGRRTLARKRFDMLAGRVGLIQPKLAANARKLLSRRGCIPVVAQLEFQGEGGVRYGSSRTLLLVARGYKVPSR